MENKKIEQVNEIIKANELGKIKIDEDAKNHCYMKVGGKLATIYYPKDVTSLQKVLNLLKEKKLKFKVLGRGSNLIFEDEYFDMFFIKISNVLDELNIINGEFIEVGAGYSLQKLAKILSKKGYEGLEFAGGIPATVGGAVFMNAGAHLKEMKDIIWEVTYLDENYDIKKLIKEKCEFEYRKSIFHKKDYIILSVKLHMKKGDKAAIFKHMSGNLEYRKEMQPLDMPSFGSVFKNPKDHHVGKLIEDLGLKGYSIGDAIISTKHANFILNNGDAKTKDIVKLIDHIKKEVKNVYSIELHEEVEIFKEK